MDTKFSTAIHALILISESNKPMSSEQIAQSVGCNSSYIRKVLGLLKKNNIISSSQGVSGFFLEIGPKDLSLYQIYRSINQDPFFDIHQNANDTCIVGRHIEATMENLLKDLEDSINSKLSQLTLADCLNIMKEELTPEELLQYEAIQNNL